MPTHQQKSKDELHVLMEARIEKEVEKRLKKRAHDEAVNNFETMSWGSDDERALNKMEIHDSDDE